jgi:hypothetical protein
MINGVGLPTESAVRAVEGGNPSLLDYKIWTVAGWNRRATCALFSLLGEEKVSGTDIDKLPWS